MVAKAEYRPTSIGDSHKFWVEIADTYEEAKERCYEFVAERGYTGNSVCIQHGVFESDWPESGISFIAAGWLHYKKGGPETRSTLAFFGFGANECACDENLIGNECTPIEVDTSIDWAAGLLYEYHDNNHDHAPRCEPIPLNDKNSCESADSDASTKAGNPIDCATGRKVQTDTDYQGFGTDPLSYVRHYQSPVSADGDASEPSRWANRTLPRFDVTSYDDDSQLATLTIGDWLRRSFYRKTSNQSWQSNPSLPSMALGHQTGGGFSIQSNGGRTYHFTANGDPVSTGRQGAQRYFYSMTHINGESRLDQVSNRFGDTLNYEYDAEGRLARLVDQDGVAIHYTYDDLGNLTEVVYPDDTPEYLADNPRKAYLYERPDFPHHLTGIVNERGDRYATFAYDDQGRKLTETVAVGTPEARTIRYSWDDTHDKLKTVETAAEVTTYSYDAHGNRTQTRVEPKIVQ